MPLVNNPKAAWLAAALVALMLATACAGAPTSSEPEVPRDASGNVTATPLSLAVTQEGELEAAMDGVLVLRGGCLGLRVEGSQDFVELVWETDGVRWVSNPASIEYRGVRASPGETVTVGGGTVPSINRVHQPDGCVDAGSAFKVDRLETD